MILSCEHNNGGRSMGLCSACYEAANGKGDEPKPKDKKSERLARELDRRGEHDAARRIREAAR